MTIPIPLIPLSLSLNWRSKDKAIAPSASQPLIDRDFLFTLAIIIVLYGTFVTLSGMVLASAARR